MSAARACRSGPLGLAVAAALAAPAAHGREAVAIAVAEPAGFADLTREREVLVDVFFGGAPIGQAAIRTAPGWVAFVDPAAAAALLPRVADRAAVEAALRAGRLPANAELACLPGSDRSLCGRLAPAIAGVIYDRDKFRLDVFLNPRLLEVPDITAERYLAPPPGGLSLIGSLGAVVTGQSNGGERNHSVFSQAVLARGERRLVADLDHSAGQGLGAETVALEWDRPGLRYSAGAMWSAGGALADRRKFVGLGLESQIDTRMDRDAVIGSPLVVYLPQRARVDLLYNGRVLASAIHEAGNRRIDTANLPDGSYEIVLRIEEPGLPAREERRFFTKSRAIPSLGRTDFFVSAGLLVEGMDHGSLAPSKQLFLAGGAAHRLSERWALGGQFESAGGSAAIELGATYLTASAQVRAAAIAESRGAYGGMLHVASTHSGPLGYSLDLRKIERARGRGCAARFAGGADLDGCSPDPFEPGPGWASGSFVQAGGFVSYSHASFRLLGTAYLRDDERDTPRYSLGPALEWDVLRSGAMTLTLRGEMAATDRGQAGFAGVSLRMFGARSSLSALGGAAASNLRGDDRGNGPVTQIAGSWSRPLAGGDLALGAGLERRPQFANASVSAEYRHPLGTASGDLVHADGPGGAALQYSLGLQTTIAAADGVVELTGKGASSSIVIARVRGARPEDRFEVLVDERVAGVVAGDRALSLTLPEYRAYDVRIRPAGDGLLAYDNAVHQVALYPGSVSRLEWTSAPVVLSAGRLVSDDGAPLRHASLTARGVWAETDEHGAFQIEAPEGAEITVTLANGAAHRVRLPAAPVSSAGFALLGTVLCCGGRGTALASAATGY